MPLMHFYGDRDKEVSFKHEAMNNNLIRHSLESFPDCTKQIKMQFYYGISHLSAFLQYMAFAACNDIIIHALLYFV